MIDAALIERYYVGAESGFLFAFFFDRSHRRVARLAGSIWREARFDRAIHPRRYVFDRNQHIQFEIAAFDFFCLRFGIETIFQIIVLLTRRFLQRVRSDVMVRDAKSMR